MPASTALRSVTRRDDAFLLRLYGTTRTDVEHFGWDDAERHAFVTMQFNAQTRANAMQHPKAEQSILTYQGRDAGRILVDRAGRSLHLIDIAVLPEFRGKGIGTTIISRLQEEAARTKRDIDLSVEITNPSAFQLYRKLGFVVTGETQTHLSMKWSPTKQ
jgi:ribosomal protein S18 acetylase RimI-like enzyme